MYEGTRLAELNIQSKEIESKAIGKKSLADAKSLLFNACKHLENVGNHEVNDVERRNDRISVCLSSYTGKNIRFCFGVIGDGYITGCSRSSFSSFSRVKWGGQRVSHIL